jgi:hypothetical protein
LENHYCDINDYRSVYVSDSIEGWLGVYPDNGPKFLGLAGDEYETYWFFQKVTDPEYLFWEDDKIYYAKGKWLEGSGVDTYPIYNLSDIYQEPDVWPIATSVSTDGDIYLSRPVPYDIYTEENPNHWEANSSSSIHGHIFSYETITGNEKRLTYSYENESPILSNDGRFMIYTRTKVSTNCRQKHLIVCSNNGRDKYAFTECLGLVRNKLYKSKYWNMRYILEGSERMVTVLPSFCRIRGNDEGFLTYYYSTPFYKTGEEDRAVDWTTILIQAKEVTIKKEPSKTYPQRDTLYKYSFEITDLHIPYENFDYVLDIRFRSDGRYISLVGVKDEVRKLYIYDLKEEELHDVEGSEGALTARWLEIIE